MLKWFRNFQCCSKLFNYKIKWDEIIEWAWRRRNWKPRIPSTNWRPNDVSGYPNAIEPTLTRIKTIEIYICREIKSLLQCWPIQWGGSVNVRVLDNSCISWLKDQVKSRTNSQTRLSSRFFRQNVTNSKRNDKESWVYWASKSARWAAKSIIALKADESTEESKSQEGAGSVNIITKSGEPKLRRAIKD